MIPGPAPVTSRPAQGGQPRSQVSRLGVKRVRRVRPRRTEHGDLAHFPVGSEDLEALPHLAESGVGDLQVQPVGMALGQPRHRDEELAQLVAVGGYTELVEQGLNAGIEVMVTGTAGPGRRRGGQRQRGSVTGRPFPGEVRRRWRRLCHGYTSTL